MTTEYAVIDLGLGQWTLLDSFTTYKEAWACAQDFNVWAETQAGDHFACVESIQVEG